MSVLINVRTCGLNGDFERGDRAADVRLWAPHETVVSEGHPRWNGDGPLTRTARSEREGAALILGATR